MWVGHYVNNFEPGEHAPRLVPLKFYFLKFAFKLSRRFLFSTLNPNLNGGGGNHPNFWNNCDFSGTKYHITSDQSVS